MKKGSSDFLVKQGKHPIGSFLAKKRPTKCRSGVEGARNYQIPLKDRKRNNRAAGLWQSEGEEIGTPDVPFHVTHANPTRTGGG